MQRRKFLIGMGSLAAGSATAMGTGALSSSEVDRTATGEIAGDADAYLRLVPYGENSEFARTEDGQLNIVFDDGGPDAPLNTQGKSNGEGLNADSVSEFDGVFRISANDNGNPFEVWIENNTQHLDFYVSGGLSQGKSYPLPIGPNNKYELSVAGNTNIDIGVRVDLDDVDDTGVVLTGDDNFTVHADRP
jgi:hypothetical protein